MHVTTLFRMILQQPLSEVFDAMGERNRRRVEADEKDLVHTPLHFLTA